MTAFVYLASFGVFTAFVAFGAIIIVFAYLKVYKGGPYYSEKNKRGLPKYKNRIDTCNLDPELTHGHHEPHV